MQDETLTVDELEGEFPERFSHILSCSVCFTV